MFSLESPYRSDPNEYTQHTTINLKQLITQNYPKYNTVCCFGIFFCQGLKNEIEIAMVNEPSVFKPLKFYCSSLIWVQERTSEPGLKLLSVLVTRISHQKDQGPVVQN